MADRVVGLISPEHAAKIDWKEEIDAEAPLNEDEEESDRLFTFEVAKTNEQEENVVIRPGFVVSVLMIDQTSTLELTTFSRYLTLGWKTNYLIRVHQT
jgi:hypothetical protein